VLDSGSPKGTLDRYMRNESRFRMVEQMYPDRYKELLAGAQLHAQNRFELYEQMAASHTPKPEIK
jgi:pyruvate-ferredoxin/flavodoxin oxidoreductase